MDDVSPRLILIGAADGLQPGFSSLLEPGCRIFPAGLAAWRCRPPVAEDGAGRSF